MGLDLQLTPSDRFSAGHEVASLITSCGVLHKSLEEICENSAEFSLKEDEGVVYVTFTFPSFSTEDFIVIDKKNGEYNIQYDEIFSACFKGGNDKPALVRKGALNLFLHILKSSDFKAKIQGLKAQSIIFAGHSMGGAVATLAALWFLKNKSTNISCFCITFGSPLVGNSVLGEAIGREDWTGNFYHVVSKHDIVPRMLLAPFESIAKALNEIMPHWGSAMGIDYGIETHLSTPGACQTLLEKVLQDIFTTANNYQGECGLGSPYRPFGTFMFCSTQGAACIDDPEAVLKMMLHFTMEGMTSDQLASTCASDHKGYSHMLEAINENLLNTMSITSFSADSFQMGIALELEAMGVGAQKHYAYLALRKAREAKNDRDGKIEKLNNDLSKYQSYMAEVEWYKWRNKNGSGYYDSFKRQGGKLELHVNWARLQLEKFWDEIVELEERHELPSDFRCQNKWINVATTYRRLVEPLDIAYYYHTRKDTKSYLEVRPHRYMILEKWKKDKELTRTGRVKKDRTKFASLTLDSCFWARIEEHQVKNPLLQESQEFENYIWGIIEDKSISSEVFVEQSSFMSWWRKYSDHRLQSPEWKSSSLLFNFMSNESWKYENSE